MCFEALARAGVTLVRVQMWTNVLNGTTLAKSRRRGAESPSTLVHAEPFSIRVDAVKRELYYETGAARDKLDGFERRTLQGDGGRSPRRLASTITSTDMGFVFALLFTIMAAAALLRAQEAAPPSVDVAPRNTARPAPSPTASVAPTIPPDLPEVSRLDEAFKQSSLGRKADEFRLHAEWRRLRNQIASAPDVVAAKKAADAARTDLEKRQLLWRYYEICYARMQALTREPEVKAGLEEMKKEHLTTLVQPRVRPSPSAIPSASSQSTAATPTPSPTPSPSLEEESESSD